MSWYGELVSGVKCVELMSGMSEREMRICVVKT